MRAPSKLKDLAARAGRWLGLAAEPAPTLPTQVVDGDRFDEMAWRDTWQQASALRDLSHDLGDRFDYTRDLLQDVWTAAYKTAPQLRGSDQVDPSREVNRQVMVALMTSPDFAELRRHTAGDSFAAAMAVVAQDAALRRLLDRSKQAQDAARAAEQARKEAAEAARQVRDAFDAAAAAAADDGTVPDDQTAAVAAAVAAAQRADQAAEDADGEARAALAKAAPGMHAAARAAARAAAEEAGKEAERAAAWGTSPGELQRMPFDERARLAKLLAGHRLAKFADLIGRFRAIAAGERARRVEATSGELVGVTLGDDLGRLVPSEVAALAVPALRADFAVRLAEGRLMMYDTRADETAGKGAIVALVDCSGSMKTEHEGVTREAWAKACALALLDQARAAGRDFTGILFSGPTAQQTFTFPRGRGNLTGVLEFGEHFFGGGTDFPTPLGQAADLLEKARERGGDIVLITDGASKVTEEWLQQWRRRREAVGFRVFGVSVAGKPAEVLEDLCDDLRTVTDLTDLDTARDLFRQI